MVTMSSSLILSKARQCEWSSIDAESSSFGSLAICRCGLLCLVFVHIVLFITEASLASCCGISAISNEVLLHQLNVHHTC